MRQANIMRSASSLPSRVNYVSIWPSRTHVNTDTVQLYRGRSYRGTGGSLKLCGGSILILIVIIWSDLSAAPQP